LYTEIGDSIADSCRIVLAIHLSLGPKIEPLVLKMPPVVPPRPIASYLWEPFNWPKHSLCYGRDDSDFNKEESAQMIVSTPRPEK
jgi:hypothetical protein